MVWFLPLRAFASNVRTLGVNNDAMAPIFLRMGKSTVLRFADKPKKVVIGNQNYYGLEFIENDVAIQPLGSVGTNLFVYTDHHTYGFLLTPGERYDDLVFVRWKYPKIELPEAQPSSPDKIIDLKTIFFIGDSLRVSISKIQGPSTFGLHIIDFEIENVGKIELDISELDIRATRDGRRLEKQSTVIELEKLKPLEKTRARIVIKLDAKADFSIEGKIKSITGKTIVSRKSL